jgi:hypothetical protein
MTKNKKAFLKITLKDNERADIDGIANCDDAILMCRILCQTQAEQLSVSTKKEFLSEMIVSVLRATVSYSAGTEILSQASSLLFLNHSNLGSKND